MIPKIMLGGIALGAIGYGVKKWLQTNESSSNDGGINKENGMEECRRDECGENTHSQSLNSCLQYSHVACFYPQAFKKENLQNNPFKEDTEGCLEEFQKEVHLEVKDAMVQSHEKIHSDTFRQCASYSRSLQIDSQNTAHESQASQHTRAKEHGRTNHTQKD